MATYLGLEEHQTEAVEQLERRDDLAMDQNGGGNRCYCPPACYWGHLIEPLFERELASLTSITPDGGHYVADGGRRALLITSDRRTEGPSRGKQNRETMTE